MAPTDREFGLAYHLPLQPVTTLGWDEAFAFVTQSGGFCGASCKLYRIWVFGLKQTTVFMAQKRGDEDRIRTKKNGCSQYRAGNLWDDILECPVFGDAVIFDRPMT